MSEAADPIVEILVRKCRGESKAMVLVAELSDQLGVRDAGSSRVVAAAALMKMGAPPESVSSLLSWNEFEEFCAGLLRAAGYTVTRNIVITKPRRQLDIFALSPDLALSVDCKHWSKGAGRSELERISRDQLERTLLYKKKKGLTIPTLPAIFTMLDVPARVAGGVPVVPIFALRDFLSTISRFEEGLTIL